MPIGCCGNRPVSLQGLLADADFYPARSSQGRKARAKLAYGIAAGKAAQQGNRVAYQRAMAGLNGLNGLGDVLTPAQLTTATASLQGAVSQLSGNASFRAALTTAGPIINTVLAAAQIGTGVASAACNGCDRTGIDVVNTILGIIRSLLQGGSPSVPAMTAATVNGFVDFCRVKDAIKGGVSTAIGFGLLAAGSDTNASNALNVIGGLINNLIESICNIAQVQIAIAASTVTADAPPPPPATPTVVQSVLCWDGMTMNTWNPATASWSGCPPRTPAVGVVSGGCTGPGAYNAIAPAGVKNPTTGALLLPAGTKSCGVCHAPGVFIPGVTDAQGFWVTPPGCVASNGHVVNGNLLATCPRGTAKDATGACVLPSSGVGAALPLAAGAAALLAWKFLF